VSLITGSATLTALFATETSPAIDPRCGDAVNFETPQWWRIWKVLKPRIETFDQHYGMHGRTVAQWEFFQPTSVVVLYALATYVLYRKVLDNPDKDDVRVPWLKWHKCYQEDEWKFYLLYNFLTSLEYYCSEGADAIDFDRPTEAEKSPTWDASPGGRLFSAAQQFQRGK
jgi:hypothetical protein